MTIKGLQLGIISYKYEGYLQALVGICKSFVINVLRVETLERSDDTKVYQLLGVVKRAINIKERFGRENKRKLLEGSVQLVFSNDRAENTLKSLISKDKLASARLHYFEDVLDTQKQFRNGKQCTGW